MKVLVYEGHGAVALGEIDKPIPRADEALIRVLSSALCGSERESLVVGHSTNTGHEAAGIVESVPEGSPFAVGERVGMTAVEGCGECGECVSGRETQCERGAISRDGWHAEYVAVPVRSLRKIPAHVDSAVAAMMSGDSLGVPSRAGRRLPARHNADVIIVGLGPVGLGHTLLRAFAGARVIGIEPSLFRRELATELGAAGVYAPGEYTTPAPLVIECSGLPRVIESSFDLVANGGTLLQSGECHTPISVNPSDLFVRREVSYTGSWYYSTEDYPYMLDVVESGLDLNRMITHRVRPHDAQAAIRSFLEGRTGKVVFDWA